MKKNILFLCYPGIGIIEQWLPILIELKKKGHKIDILFFDINHLFQFEQKNYVHKVAMDTFDNFFYDNRSNVNKIISLKEINFFQNNFLRFFFKNRYIKKTKHNFKKFIINYNTILYDTYFDLVDRFNYSILLKDKKKFSLHHGVALFKQKKSLSKKKNFYRVNNQIFFQKDKDDLSNLTIFNYTRDEIFFWKFIYKNQKIKNIRVPIFKNKKSWILKIIKNSKKDFSNQWKDYVFLISRSVNEDYFTSQSKENHFYDIVKICAYFKKKLVIRFHPKENKKLWKKKYIKILNKFKLEYNFSESHPFKIAKNSILTICYFSELSVSLASLNIPVIEYLNLKNKIDKKKSLLRDKNNRPVFDYRYLNLVKGVDDYKTLKKTFVYIIKNRKSVINKTHKIYLKLFISEYEKINKIVKIISKVS